MSVPYLTNHDLATIVKALTDEGNQLPWPENTMVTPELINSLAMFIVERVNADHAGTATNRV